jgi:hypothetical protein
VYLAGEQAAGRPPGHPGLGPRTAAGNSGTPAITARLNEEKIRDLLLAILNARFEGAAVGEAFNAAGKTDILIRAGDRNVLIAGPSV